MRDWKRLVRERLPELRLSGPREAEIVEELGLQLEETYREALLRGRDEQAAEEDALSQVGDWNELARAIRAAEQPLTAPLHQDRPATRTATSSLPAAQRERRASAGRLVWSDLWRDLRHGGRMLGRSPGATALAVATLALGIGANTAIFSLVDGIALRRLPYADPERLARVWQSGAPKGAVVALHDASRTMDLAAFVGDLGANLKAGEREPTRLQFSQVSANLMPLLGVRPALGRLIRREEEAPAQSHVAVLSYALWQERFGGKPEVIGQWLELDDVRSEVIGVMPAGFHFPSPATQLWTPLAIARDNHNDLWGNFFTQQIGRLRPGVSLEQARAELRSLIPRIVKLFPWPMPAHYGEWNDVIPLQQYTVGDVRTKLAILLGAVGLVLLIACANVIILLLSRAAARQNEMAIRAALGASRGRLVLQLLAESSLVTLAGGVLGVVLASPGLLLLERLLPADTPRLPEVSIDASVLLFAAALCVLTGILFGLAPALRASRPALDEALQSSQRGGGANRGSRRFQTGLVIAETAVAMVVAIGAGLLCRSLWGLSRAELGFVPDRVVTARFTPSLPFCSESHRCADYYRQLLERTRALPGVVDAALTDNLPAGAAQSTVLAVEGNPRYTATSPLEVWQFAVSPGYFRTMGIRLLAGRDFAISDGPRDPGVVLVSRALAERLWPAQSPIGKRLKPSWMEAWRTVVGVVGDVRENALPAETAGARSGDVYVPAAQGVVDPPPGFALVAQVRDNPRALLGELRELAAQLRPVAPVSELRTLEDQLWKGLAAPRSTALLFVLFALLALVLGAIGLYSVMSHGIAERTHEIGVRIALGAERRQVLAMVVRQAMTLATIGMGLGTAAALAGSRLLVGLLHGTPATDPLTYLGVIAVLGAVALVAVVAPALRAMRVDPLTALRHD